MFSQKAFKYSEPGCPLIENGNSSDLQVTQVCKSVSYKLFLRPAISIFCIQIEQPVEITFCPVDIPLPIGSSLHWKPLLSPRGTDKLFLLFNCLQPKPVKIDVYNFYTTQFVPFFLFFFSSSEAWNNFENRINSHVCYCLLGGRAYKLLFCSTYKLLNGLGT